MDQFGAGYFRLGAGEHSSQRHGRRARGVEVLIVNDEECVRLMRDFIAERPELWNEDVGECRTHPGRVLVLFADGHTQWLPDSIDPEMLKSWLTIDGNEKIPPPGP